jgi:hypothetical protein
LEALLAAAVTKGELAKTTDVPALAQTLEVVLNGSLITWAFYQEGTPATWLRTNADAVLAPHLATSRRARK